MRQSRFIILFGLQMMVCRAAFGAGGGEDPSESQPAKMPLPAQRPILLEWTESDHVSAIYHVKADARLMVTAVNTSMEPAEFSGEVLFGPRSAGEFKPLTVVPVTRTMLAPKQRVQLPLAVTFAAAGGYELRLRQGETSTLVEGSNGRALQCIFAPRVDARKDSRWITLLPAPAAVTPGYLPDYAAQTSVRRFLIDERFYYDARTNVGLGFGASTGASTRQLDALFEEAGKAKIQLTLRLTLPLQMGPDAAESVKALRKYMEDAVRRSRGILAAVVMVPELQGGVAPSDSQRVLFQSYYETGREAAKRVDKNVQFLGPGSAALAAELFRGDPKFSGMDALAISDASIEPMIAAHWLGERSMALQLLPAATGLAAPAAAALAVRAEVVAVPPPDIDNGVTAHLLGGTTFAERLHLALPSKDPAAPNISSVPFIGLFQGDGYSVAAIAGFGAGTDLDGLYPSLGRAATEVQNVRADLTAGYPNLEVGDDSRSMRVVDAQGSPIECRSGGGGDNLFVPAGGRVVYLLEANAAEELAGSLRPSVPHHLPLFEVKANLKEGVLKLQLRNISAETLRGTVRVLGTAEGAEKDAVPVPVAEKELGVIPPGTQAEIAMEVEQRVNRELPLVVEITTAGAKGVIQRTAVPVAP